MQIKIPKRAILGFIACLGFFFSVLFVSATAHAVEQNEEISIAVSQDSYPFHFVDEQGEPAGILVDFWKKWSEKTGVSITFVVSDFSTSIENVKTGSVELHAGCFYSEERAEFLEFGFPVIEVETHIFYDGSQGKVSNLKELNAYKIGVIKGDYAEGYLNENLPDSSLITFESYGSMLAAADAGQIKAFVADTLTVLYEMNKSDSGKKFKYDASAPLYSNYIYVAAEKGNFELIEEVNLGMSTLTYMERDAIIAKWTQEYRSDITLRVALMAEYPPFSYADENGDPQGLMVDLWRLWGQKTNREVAFDLRNLDESLLLIKNGEADIHSGLFQTPERDKYMVFGQILYPVESRIFYDPQYTKYARFEDLNDKNIGVIKGSYQESYYSEKYTEMNSIPMSNGAIILEAFENRLLDGFIAESMNIHGIIERQGKTFYFNDIPGSEISMDMKAAVSKENPELIKLVNSGFDAISEDEWILLENKWISDPRDRVHSKVKPIDFTEEEIAWIIDHPTIQVGAISGFLPYDDNVSGAYTGISADYMNYIFKQIGIEPIVIFDLWQNLMDTFMKPSGPEVLFSTVNTEERSEKMLFTEPYLKIPQIVVSRKEIKAINSLEDLSGLKVVAEKGYYKVDYINQNPDIELIFVDNTLNALLAVSSGQADAYIGDIYSIEYYMKNNSIRNLRTSTYTSLPLFELSVAVGKDERVLRNIIQKCISAMPEINRKTILDKYSINSNMGDLILSEAEEDWLDAHSDIRYTMQSDWKPISFLRADNYPSGIGYAVWERCLDPLGIQGVMQSAPNYWSAIESIVNGSSDIIIAAVKSPEKLKYMNFSEPYLESPLIIMSHEDGHLVSSLEELDREKVGFISGSFAEDIIKLDFPLLDFVTFSTAEAAYNALSNKKIDVLLDSLFSSDYSMDSLGYKNIRVSGITGYTYEICIGVRKDWPELVNLINRVIGTMSESERTAIEETWVTQTNLEKTDWTKPLIALGIIGFVLVVIISSIVYWNRKLQAEIIERKLIENELVYAKELADIANSSKSAFLANMSHEIRTPMNAIIGMINIMNNTELNARQNEYLSKISHAAYSLLVVINDILDFSKIEAGKLTIESTEFKLGTLLDHVSDIVSVKAREKDIELLIRREPDIPEHLYGDSLRIEQILINLANNAVKFTSSGEVEISVKSSHQEPSEITLEFGVRDTGIGMDDSELDKLFKPFMQSDSSITRKYGGTGLGLSISRRLADLMGGRIWAKCIPDKGCNFYFELKMPYNSDGDIDYLGPDLGLENHRVLVVDDNRTALEILSAQLKAFEVDSDWVQSGKDAIEKIKNTPYDLILMDWRMPELDGFETARRIRNLPDIHQPHIAIVTAYGQDPRIYDGNLRIDAVLHKPVSESSLYNTLQNVLLGTERLSKVTRQNRIHPDFLSGFKILSVEDNPLNQQIVKELLELSGAVVYQVSNGIEALEWTEKNKELPDAILMDLQMPQLDGYETSKRLRSLTKYAKTPILAMTADAMAGVYEKCLAAGMDDYISKPINLEELYGKLGNFLKIDKSAFIIENYEVAQDDQEVDKALFDVNSARLLLGGNETLLIKILTRFKEEYRDFETQCDSIFESETSETIIRYFHTLKASAGSIGSKRIHDLAESVEHKLQTRGEEDLEPLTTPLKQALNDLLSRIAKHLESYQIEEFSRVELLTYETLIGRLREVLEKRKPAEIEAILGQIDLDNFQNNEKEILNAILVLCSKYRYKEALKFIENAIN